MTFKNAFFFAFLTFLVPNFMRFFHFILYANANSRMIELSLCLLYETHVNFT